MKDPKTFIDATVATASIRILMMKISTSWYSMQDQFRMLKHSFEHYQLETVTILNCIASVMCLLIGTIDMLQMLAMPLVCIWFLGRALQTTWRNQIVISNQFHVGRENPLHPSAFSISEKEIAKETTERYERFIEFHTGLIEFSSKQTYSQP